MNQDTTGATANGRESEIARAAAAAASPDPAAEEDAAHRLMRDADVLLHGKSGAPSGFVAQFFAGAALEDLLQYDAPGLAAIAAGTWELLQQRKPGVPLISIRPAPAAPDTRSSRIAVIDIVNDDMPFLVDSVMSELTERGLDARLMVHPIFRVTRDPAGKLTALASTSPDAAAARESVIQVHVDRADASDAALTAALDSVLADVRHAVDDWRPMKARLAELTAEIKSSPPPLPPEELAESIAFLDWLLDDNFTFLGVRDYRLSDDGTSLASVADSALGVFRAESGDTLSAAGGRVELSERARAAMTERKLLLITKTSTRSRVHRRVFMDQVGVKHYDPDGRVTGGLQVVGLFTSTAYTRSTRSIPYLRRTVANVVARAGFNPSSHSGKALVNVIETYPRDELFQIDEETLFGFALTILQLNERPRVRVLPRPDRFERFVSVLVFVPRENYDSGARLKIGILLAASFHGRVADFTPYFLEGPLVRVQFIIAHGDAPLAAPPRAVLESEITRLIKTWPDQFIETLSDTYGAAEARTRLRTYGAAFSASYRDAFSAREAVDDIKAIEAVSTQSPVGVDFQRGDEAADGHAHLKLWSLGRPIPLSERVPMLEHMGFTVVDESTYPIRIGATEIREFWLHHMVLDRIGGRTMEIDGAKPRLDACLTAVMSGEAESDGYNALVLAAGLAWRDVALVRTLSRYMRQISVPYSQGYMWATQVKHAAIAARIVSLFGARFDPASGTQETQRSEREAAIVADIEERLTKVDSLDEDRILRQFVTAVQAAVRTNFYQRDAAGNPKPEIAVKFESRKIAAVPLPRPRFEIFMCSPRFEAVHMRFGPVARGGIRWSDRPQDFRTEILGLVKAQQVKNAVIVPVGAKGGFVPKRLPAGNREAFQAEGMATYRIFMSTMLDITDNLELGRVVPPKDVIRHDGDDPYLVVAADKGTATFSDIANGIAQQHGFWLDDAFASGGSAGYDHKRMGITARGAWESVKRHFREMDTDIAAAPFSVVGVGDMSGDVFGNGMLRERTIRLIAAFDHRDIFIDPNPDPARSFQERERMFNLPRSSWQDFDRSIISRGGGVFSRSLKEIPLSPEARAALGITAAKATAQEVMTAILKASVDLLWFGGIGTYVRASTESDEAAGDRANDAIRVTGAALRCKVVGEGANLGMTQRGRIEAALRGIRLNTDAIDNSAGVNTSDVEVNLKIALNIPMRDGRLPRPDRDVLLAEMTDDVAALVLRNNYQQTLALSLAARRGLDHLGFQQRMMQMLEKEQLLDRTVEFLPSDLEITERQRRAQPLTRPELAVLLAYAKLALHDELLKTSVPDDPYLSRELDRYFPRAIATRFPDAIQNHRLRRDIISTQLANSMINRAGPSLIARITDQTDAPVERIAAAFAAVRDSFGLTALNGAIEDLDNKIPGDLQLTLFTSVQDLVLNRMVWFLRNVDLARGLAAIVDQYRAGIAGIYAALDQLLTAEAQRARSAEALKLATQGVPEALALQIVSLPAMASAADAVLIAERTSRPAVFVAGIYFATVAYFQIDRIVATAADIKLVDYFDRLAYDRSLDVIEDAVRRLTARITQNGGTGPEAVAAWIRQQGPAVDRVRQAVHEIAASGLTLSKLTVASSMLADLARDG